MSLDSFPSRPGSSVGADDPSLMSRGRLLSAHLELRGQYNSLRESHALLVNAVGAKMDTMEHGDAVGHSQSTLRDVKTDSLLLDADGLTQKERLLLDALDPALYRHVKFWFKIELTRWAKAKDEKKRREATTFGEQERPQPLHGKASVSQGINIAYPFYENSNGETHDGHQVTAINAYAKQIIYHLLQKGVAPDVWGVAGDSAARIFQSRMYTRFPDLRLCDGHWKVEYIATKLYSGARNYYFKGQARIKIKQETINVDEIRSKRARSNTSAASTSTKKLRADVQDAASAPAEQAEANRLASSLEPEVMYQSKTSAGRAAAPTTSMTTAPVVPAPARASPTPPVPAPPTSPVPASPTPTMPALPTPPMPASPAPTLSMPAHVLVSPTPAPPVPALPASASPAPAPTPGSTTTTTGTSTPILGAPLPLVAPPPRSKRPSQLKKPSLTSKEPKNLFAEVWCEEKLGKGRVDEFNEAWENLDIAKKEEYKALSKLKKDGGNSKRGNSKQGNSKGGN
ncbi:hypothetical protein BOTBODRAFT_174626 [Botryobasidium botryosum FD-172 SS1]|uniref:Uncharacterized protein n=1 Tax=Botryobasidium botryosum (strain FD-172 SS1) TaxID=930990 RepID=A0A067MS85_BOTB1|nr:hypothetical protein BOTBODRAFT_174626 [Botryobasidium botryosum FD-172 SS1]